MDLKHAVSRNQMIATLRQPNYGRYVAGNSVSLIGLWMHRIAVGWLTWKLTESGFWLGAVAFADLAPSITPWWRWCIWSRTGSRRGCDV